MKDKVTTVENKNEVVNKRQEKTEVCSGKNSGKREHSWQSLGEDCSSRHERRQAALRGKDEKKGMTQEMKRRFPSEEHQSIID